MAGRGLCRRGEEKPQAKHTCSLSSHHSATTMEQPIRLWHSLVFRRVLPFLFIWFTLPSQAPGMEKAVRRERPGTHSDCFPFPLLPRLCTRLLQHFRIWKTVLSSRPSTSKAQSKQSFSAEPSASAHHHPRSCFSPEQPWPWAKTLLRLTVGGSGWWGACPVSLLPAQPCLQATLGHGSPLPGTSTAPPASEVL